MMEILTVNQAANGKFFIMGNKGQIPNTPYFRTMKEASITMFQICRTKKATNIYDMPQKMYEKEILGK